MRGQHREALWPLGFIDESERGYGQEYIPLEYRRFAEDAHVAFEDALVEADVAVRGGTQTTLYDLEATERELNYRQPGTAKAKGKAPANESNESSFTVICDSEDGLMSDNVEAVTVTLLQMTLRSSQYEKLRECIRLPVSGHWAILIRDEVFELNRTDAWEWLSWETYHKKWLNSTTTLGVRFVRIYSKVWLASLKFYGCAFQFGANARIDRCTLQQYVNDRGSQITASALGITTLSQEEIYAVIDDRTGGSMFYSLFSSNCQHFALELCENINVRFGRHPAVHFDAAEQNRLQEASEQSLVIELSRTGAATIQSLWIKSRLIFFLASLAHLGLSVVSSLVPIWLVPIIVNEQERAKGTGLLISWAVEILTDLLTYIIYFLPIWLLFCSASLSAEKPPRTLDGNALQHAACSTGAFTRKQLIENSGRFSGWLVRILLRVEKIPYWLSTALGHVINICVTMGGIWIPALYLGTDKSFYIRALQGVLLTIVYVIALALVLNTWQYQKSRVRSHNSHSSLTDSELESLSESNLEIYSKDGLAASSVTASNSLEPSSSSNIGDGEHVTSTARP